MIKEWLLLPLSYWSEAVKYFENIRTSIVTQGGSPLWTMRVKCTVSIYYAVMLIYNLVPQEHVGASRDEGHSRRFMVHNGGCYTA